MRLKLREDIGRAVLPDEGDFFTALGLLEVLNPIGDGLIGCS
jgi:hypothetical protein